MVKTAESMAIEVIRLLLNTASREEVAKITVEIDNRVAEYLNNRKRQEIAHCEERGNVKIDIISRSNVIPEFMVFRCRDADGHELKL